MALSLGVEKERIEGWFVVVEWNSGELWWVGQKTDDNKGRGGL